MPQVTLRRRLHLPPDSLAELPILPSCCGGRVKAKPARWSNSIDTRRDSDPFNVMMQDLPVASPVDHQAAEANPESKPRSRPAAMALYRMPAPN